MARCLENWLDEYIHHTVHSEAPEKFHFWTGVSTIAGALRKKVWLPMGHFQWFPNFYIFFVAPPGIATKSTTTTVGMDMLRELGYINFGPSAGTWQALITRMTGIREDFQLPSGEFWPMSAITMNISELGTFLDPKERLQIDVLVDLWDGKQGVWDKSTKKDGSEEIVNPWINILGATTPSWIADSVGDYFAGGGFMSRSVFVYADKKSKLIAYPEDHFPDDFYEQRDKLTNDLREISSLCGPFTLDPEAKAWGKDWYDNHWGPKGKVLDGEKFAGYRARKQTHTHKLAMVLSAADNDTLIISKRHLMLATEKVTELEAEMPKIFGHMNREKEVSLAADVLSVIIASGETSQTILYNQFMRTITFDTFEKIIRSLKHAGRIKEVNKGNSMYLAPVNSKKDEV